jgi:A nuclease of the HNH/ENDO VII superfamily with conserved WHH
MLKGTIDGVTSYVDFIQAITVQLQDTITGAINAIILLFSKTKVVINFILDKIDEFNKKDIYSKYEFFGQIIGNFVPDIIITVFASNFASVLANIGGKIARILQEFSKFVDAFKGVINAAEKFIGKSIPISGGALLPIISIGGKTVSAGKDIAKLAREASDETWARLVKLIPDAQKLGRLETFRKFVRLACTGYTIANGAVFLTRAIPEEFIPVVSAKDTPVGINPGDTYYYPEGSKGAVDHPEGVKYDSKGYPRYEPLAYETKGVKVIVQVDGLIGTQKIGSNDFDRANAAAGISDDFLVANSLTWHHVENGRTMLLIETKYHSTKYGGPKHIGGASYLRDYILSIKDIC